MQNDIAIIAKKAIEEKIFPGCVVGVLHESEKTILPFGNFTYETGAREVRHDSIFDVASITKSIPTSSLILKFIDEGRVSADELVVKFIPELKNIHREEITIKHLLTFTVIFDINRLSSNKNRPPAEILNVIFNAELRARPGMQFLYTNAPSILLGLIAERVMGKSLDVLADEIFFDPLGMAHTTFHPQKLDKNNIVPTEFDDWRGRLLQGEVHDETAYALRNQLVSGNAGLFSNAPDLLVFMEMFLQQGKYQDQIYFSQEIVRQMHTNQLTEIGESTGLGWELNQPRFMGQYCNAATFGKTGFTGCIFLCDISKQRGLVLLSNAVHPKRRADSSLINKVRSSLADIVFK